jgi:hypothetical protein
MMKSAFDDDEQYELTALGEQFIHHAMTDIPPKLSSKRQAKPQKGHHRFRGALFVRISVRLTPSQHW